MSLTGALNAALSGIRASTTAAQLISSNVANAQTAGYTEKSLALSAVITGTNFGGVQIDSYSRVSDSVLA
ncbi:MAG: flagellar hook-associated protein FlgK, partial [Alphaproteobacteria bacterium]|nr:flagellar hook-associated protein FlgK [Alphaproteobacteria bacterium]